VRGHDVEVAHEHAQRNRLQVSDEITERLHLRPRRRTWIVVCEDLHGAVGPVPTEELAIDLATAASSIGRCNYRPVLLAVSAGPNPKTVMDDTATNEFPESASLTSGTRPPLSSSMRWRAKGQTRSPRRSFCCSSGRCGRSGSRSGVIRADSRRT
jgi:hypothetical protein